MGRQQTGSLGEHGIPNGQSASRLLRPAVDFRPSRRMAAFADPAKVESPTCCTLQILTKLVHLFETGDNRDILLQKGDE
jgi:hypothetical protein